MNPADEVSVKRVLNVPKRGVGETSMARFDSFASAEGITFAEALRRADEAGVTGSAARGVAAFVELLDHLATLVPEGPGDLLQGALEASGYLAELEAEHTVEAAGRLENLGELVGSARDFAEVAEFIEQVALVADSDEVDGDESRIILMTLHTAKGLEYPVVFLVGAEEGVFPHIRALTRARRARGGAAPRVRRDHPGPRAPLHLPCLEPDAVRLDAVQPAEPLRGRDPERARRGDR